MNLARTFRCQLGTLPFTYLGLPLGTTKPRVDDYMPLMDRTEKKAYLSLIISHPSWEIAANQLCPLLLTNLCNVQFKNSNCSIGIH